ncbi:hypothetical protein PR202_gb04461 [Eleusine coracana subsp. coracana]|uniref:VQ domain-containing protein n=1 Tax=Eleusine coracana subsp. coracana TaxID=191504 RepID=A0AAV5E276_ELECO|nr:hypothetical protein QOZ80_1BG0087260 [Eleusine coracana subsp. coracana]GJN17399.1 hypothetical protein PR202_gb04461 [Eleusine coracana subsp. coracana]
MDHQQRRQRQSSPRGNAPGPGIGNGGASSGRQKGGGGGGKGGGKKPIKVVYISNPMRVKTSAARFRALVQELTGRHADPSKYSPDDLVAVGGADAAAAAIVDIDDAAQGLSPGDALASSDTVVASPSAAADHQPDAAAAASLGGFYDEDDEYDDGFRSQLLENNYAVLSSPTLLYDYGHHPHS